MYIFILHLRYVQGKIGLTIAKYLIFLSDWEMYFNTKIFIQGQL